MLEVLRIHAVDQLWLQPPANRWVGALSSESNNDKRPHGACRGLNDLFRIPPSYYFKSVTYATYYPTGVLIPPGTGPHFSVQITSLPPRLRMIVSCSRRRVLTNSLLRGTSGKGLLTFV
jgi:hypothetical protein